MHTVTVDVTDSDIAAGRDPLDGECPLVLAIRRATRRRDVAVSAYYALLGTPGTPEAVLARLPPEATHFVQAWDRRPRAEGMVAPFRFELIVPRPKALAQQRQDGESPRRPAR